MTTSKKTIALRLLKKQLKINKTKYLLVKEESELREAIDQAGYVSEVVVHQDKVYTVKTNGIGGCYPTVRAEEVCTVEDLKGISNPTA